MTEYRYDLLEGLDKLTGLNLSGKQHWDLWELLRHWSQLYPGIHDIPTAELLEGLGLVTTDSEGIVRSTWELKMCLQGSDGRSLRQWILSWARYSRSNEKAGIEVTCTLWCSLGNDFLISFEDESPVLTDKSWSRFEKAPRNPILENALMMFGGPKPWTKERVLKWRRVNKALTGWKAKVKDPYNEWEPLYGAEDPSMTERSASAKFSGDTIRKLVALGLVERTESSWSYEYRAVPTKVKK